MISTAYNFANSERIPQQNSQLERKCEIIMYYQCFRKTVGIFQSIAPLKNNPQPDVVNLRGNAAVTAGTAGTLEQTAYNLIV